MRGSKHSLVVSVITVVRNDAPGLARTMDSVAAQDYPHREFIIIDGGSTDGTLELLRQRGGEVTHWISEPDDGIYQAMNKGVRLASGDFVCFMNAGDCFASADALSRMMIPAPNVELLWGDCIIRSDRGEQYDSAKNVLPRLHRQMTVCHQSLFTRRAALVARPYSEAFRIASDYDFLCERLLAGAGYEYRPVPVSRIDDRGASARAYRTSIREKRLISIARFPSKRGSIRLYYAILSLYMTAKRLLGGLRAG